MPTELPMIYWDACVPLSYINGIDERLRHIDPLMRQSGVDFQIVTSVLTITEVAFARIEQDSEALDTDTERKIARLWQVGSPIRIVEFYELIAWGAQQLMRAAISKGWKLKPADAIHLATADNLKVKEFHTYDEKLDKYSELSQTKFPIIRPISNTPGLALKGSTASQDTPSASESATQSPP